MKSTFRIDQNCFFRGEDAEKLFVSIAEKRGYKCEKSTKFEDRKKHIDLWLTKGKERWSADVKSLKRGKMCEKTKHLEWVWLEFLNVGGNTGWLLSEVDYIAFQRDEDSFLVVNRESLLYYVTGLLFHHGEPFEDVKSPELDESKLVWASFIPLASTSKNAEYSLYSRKDRNDLLTKIEFTHLYNVKHFIFEN